MKIAIITEGFRPFIGGVETRYTRIAEALADRHYVDVFTLIQNTIPETHNSVQHIEEDGRLTIYRIYVGRDYLTQDGTRSISGVIEFARRCTELLLREDYDAVFLSEWPLLHILYIYLKRGEYSRRMVVEWHEVWREYYFRHGVKGLVGYFLEELVANLRNVQHVAVSEFTKERLSKISARDDIAVIHNGIDLKEFSSGVNVERQHGKILFFGRFTPHKGIDKLVKAYSILRKQGYRVSLHVVGDGPLRDHVMRLAKENEGMSVHLSLPREKLIEHIHNSWVVAIPSEREGQGIAFLESMAAGTPVVTVNALLNAFSKMVSNGVEAIITNPDPASIASSIAQLITDHDMWTKLSINGRAYAAMFSWDRIIPRLESLLRKIAEGTGK